MIWLTLLAGLNATATTPAPPRLFLLDAAGLAVARARLAEGEPTVVAAVEQLRREAEAALSAGPWSVMNKTVVPPSGDKHDYLSIGPYWWPDPTKPDGLPYIRRDGQVNPERNSDADDSVGLGKVARTAELLALAWWFGGEERFADRAALLLRVWFLEPATRMNPHLQFGQAIPGRTAGRGIGIIDTASLTRVVEAVGLLGVSPSWQPADQTGLVTWFEQYLDWLLTSSHGREEARAANNHGTWYDVQVASFARFVGRDDLAREVLSACLARRIAPQIRPDGSQPHELARTKSFSYSAMNLQAFFHLATLAAPLGLDLWGAATEDGRSLRRALDYLAAYVDEAVPWPHEQLGGGSFRGGLSPLLRRAAKVWAEPRYEALRRQLKSPSSRDDLLDPWTAPPA